MPRLNSSGWKSGDIRIWTRPLNEIPNGWQLCDGTNGTPDMCDRAIVGAGRAYAHGAKFGGDSVRPTKPSVSVSVNNHTLSQSQMPSHVHSYKRNNQANNNVGNLSLASDGTLQTYTSGGAGSSSGHSHGTSVSIGEVGLVDTRQQSIAVNWIMKL